MARTTAPLLSFGANGQIGKTQVYGSWRGVKYARRYVVPANPNSLSQQATRSVFKWLSATWKLMDPAVQQVWFDFAKGKPLTDRNAWVKSNLFNLRGTDSVPATTIDLITASPGVNGGLAFSTLVLSDSGTQHATATMTAPALPTGWTITAAHAIAWKEQDANSAILYTSYYATDASAGPYAPVIALGAAMTAVVSAFFEYAKPDGSVAYSPAITGTIAVA